MKKNKKHRVDHGYTLIELLIVMTVVALLSSISIFALQGSRASARDAQRKGDLEAIRSALELYKSDCNTYPSGSGNFSMFGSSFGSEDGGCTAVSGTRTYLTEIPDDPQGTNGYRYNRLTDHTYQLCATLEEAPVSPQNCGGVGNYRVSNP